MLKTSYRIMMLLMIAVCLAGILTGILGTKSEAIKFPGKDKGFILTPCQKSDGDPFSISIVELSPPIESSYLWLKGFLSELQTDGYITAELDFDKLPGDYEGLYQAVAETDLGGSVVFDKTCYLLTDDNQASIASELRKKTEEKQIDLIVGMGTDTGSFVKNLNLGLPFLTAMATDPVAAGIIKSKTDTGDPDTWALVEENPMGRQLEAYQRLFDFEKLGMITVTEYEAIAAIPEYEKKAKELGVQVVKESISEKSLQEKELVTLKKEIRKMAQSDIDAFLLTYGVVPDETLTGALFEGLAEKKIPLLVSDGNGFVKNGGLICISSYDYEGYGHHAAKLASSIFHGEKAGSFSCLYISSPYIVFNMDAAKKIGFQADFEFLQSCDEIYHIEER